jgi:WD40 repeat protein
MRKGREILFSRKLSLFACVLVCFCCFSFAGTSALFATCSATGLHIWTKRVTKQAAKVVYDCSAGVPGACCDDSHLCNIERICRKDAEDQARISQSRRNQNIETGLTIYCVLRPRSPLLFLLLQLLVATSTGEFILWENRVAIRSVKAHEGAVCILQYNPKARLIISGGCSDAQAKLWDSNLDCTCVFDLSAIDAEKRPQVVAVSLRPDMSTALVGTSDCAVFEFWARPTSIEEGAVAGKPKSTTPLLAGHAAGELWGVAVSPTADEVVTASDDLSVRLWDCTNQAVKV